MFICSHLLSSAAIPSATMRNIFKRNQEPIAAPATTTATISTGLLDNSTESGSAGESKEDMLTKAKDKFFNEFQKIPCECPRWLRGRGEARVSERPCGQGRVGKSGEHHWEVFGRMFGFQDGLFGESLQEWGRVWSDTNKGKKGVYVPQFPRGGKVLTT